MRDGAAAFEALPKHVRYARLIRYFSFYEAGLRGLLDVSSWSTEDRLQMRRIAGEVNQGERGDGDAGGADD